MRTEEHTNSTSPLSTLIKQSLTYSGAAMKPSRAVVSMSDDVRTVLSHLAQTAAANADPIAMDLKKKATNKRCAVFESDVLDDLYERYVGDYLTFVGGIEIDGTPLTEQQRVNWLDGLFVLFESAVDPETQSGDGSSYQDVLVDGIEHHNPPPEEIPAKDETSKLFPGEQFEEDPAPDYKRRNAPNLQHIIDDAVEALSDIERALAAALTTETTKDRQARIFWSVYMAVEIDPDTFSLVNFDAKTQKPIVKLQESATNRKYQLVSKFIHVKMRRAMGLDEKGARTSYCKWAQAFRWAADEKGITTREGFRELLNTVSFNEMIENYHLGKNGPSIAEREKPVKIGESEADQDETDTSGSSPSKVELMFDRLKLTRLKVALSRLPDSDPDKAELVALIESLLAGFPADAS